VVGPVYVLTKEMRDRAYDASLVQALVREANDALGEYNDLTVMENVSPALARAAVEGMVEVFETMAETDVDMRTAIESNQRLRAFRN